MHRFRSLTWSTVDGAAAGKRAVANAFIHPPRGEYECKRLFQWERVNIIGSVDPNTLAEAIDPDTLVSIARGSKVVIARWQDLEN